MKDRLPVNIENYTLPEDKFKSQDGSSNEINNYGYVSIMYLISLIITLSSVLFLIIMGA